MPTPRPETSETTSAVEKPGVKISSMISRSRQAIVGRDQSLLDAARAHFFEIDTAAVVGHLDDDLIAFVIGIERDRSDARLAERSRVRRAPRCRDRRCCAASASAARRLRRRSSCRDRSPRPRSASCTSFPRALATSRTRARETIEDLADRHHAHLHDRLLDFVGRARKQRRRVGEIFASGATMPDDAPTL